jgi:zinc-finger of transposase IS204/IS1001/IS1096/IS1165
VEIEEVSRVGGLVRVLARTTARVAACSGCGAVSRRVQSRYERRLLDTAIGGWEVVLCLAVRRFACLSPECAKVTFAEQVSGLTSRYARRTPAVTAMLEAVALALGGCPDDRPVSGCREPDHADPADPRHARSRAERVAQGAGSRRVRCARGTATGRCSSTSRPGVPSTSWRSGPRTRSPPGCKPGQERR